MRHRMLKRIMLGVFGVLFLSVTTVNAVFAEESWYGISMSPLNQSVSLKPGETYTGTFNINNSSSHDSDFLYTVDVNPFYVDENDTNIYDQKGSYNQITDWTTLNNYDGNLEPGESATISYTINVPENAPAGGQYMAITVTSNESLNENTEEMSAGITAKQAMAFLVYAKIAGNTVHSGEIFNVNVPGFLLSGNIGGTSSVSNTGNVHGTVAYRLQVFPLFSDEEVYTNEEDPETRVVLPDRTLMNTLVWENTPSIGVFNVKYTVEFDGADPVEINKIVVICPLWLLFIIILVIIMIIIWIVAKIKSYKKSENK